MRNELIKSYLHIIACFYFWQLTAEVFLISMKIYYNELFNLNLVNQRISTHSFTKKLHFLQQVENVYV